MTDSETEILIEFWLRWAGEKEINLGSEYARKILTEKIKEELDKADN
jgi:hypothetical protein